MVTLPGARPAGPPTRDAVQISAPRPSAACCQILGCVAARVWDLPRISAKLCLALFIKETLAG
jgi:hypothetical protein